MILCYSGRSKPSALAIAEASNGEIIARRSNEGDVSWGRASANTSLNSDTSNCTNKRVMRQLFKEHGVPMPRLMPPDNGDYRLALPIINNYPVVGRPDTHTKGRGFWKCDNWSDVKRALRGTRKKKAATHFMEYIEADHEYRVHIFGGKSIRISEKKFGSTGETAHGKYTTIKPTGEVDHVRKAAKQAVDSLGLDFGAVDILATDTECWVLEVNAAPGLGGSTPLMYAQTFLKWGREQ